MIQLLAPLSGHCRGGSLPAEYSILLTRCCWPVNQRHLYPTHMVTPRMYSCCSEILVKSVKRVVIGGTGFFRSIFSFIIQCSIGHSIQTGMTGSYFLQVFFLPITRDSTVEFGGICRRFGNGVLETERVFFDPTKSFWKGLSWFQVGSMEIIVFEIIKCIESD